MLAPGAGVDGWLGLPLGPAGLFIAAIVVLAAVALEPPGPRAARILLAAFASVAVARLVLGAFAPQVGFKAAYYGSAETDGRPERSTEYPFLADATRIERELALVGNAFAVHFFNDTARFNRGQDARPSRDQLPFSVLWTGTLVRATGGEVTVAVTALGRAAVWIDDRRVLGLSEENTPVRAESTLELGPGVHAVRVEYARPEARIPRLEVSWRPSSEASMRVLGAPDVYVDRVAVERAQVPPMVAMAGGVALTGMVLGLLAGWVVLGARASRGAAARVGLGVVPLLFLAQGVALHGHVAGRASILSGFDDWLTHESSARDILLNGVLMANGQSQAPPFYAQPFYPYALAAMHAVTGESVFGPIVVQYALLGLLLVSTAVLGWRLFGRGIPGLAALAAFWLVALHEHGRVARQLFNENLYMPLVMLSLIALVTLARRHRPPGLGTSVLVGALLGLTAITRSQWLLFLPAALGILWLAWRRPRTRRASAGALVGILVGVAALIAPVGVRNWVVSGQVVPIATSAGASLLEFHRPPAGVVDAGAIARDPLYQALGLDTPTRTVVEYARRDPLGYGSTLVAPLQHTIGLPGPTRPANWVFLVSFLAYLLAIVLVPRARSLAACLVHAFVATHLVIMALFEADTYGYRLVLPMYAPLVVVAAQLLPWLGRRSARVLGPFANAPRVAGAALVGVACSAAILQQASGTLAAWPDRELTTHGLGGAAAQAVRLAEASGADIIYVASSDGNPRSFGAGTLPGLHFARFKWFDPQRALPAPPPDRRAVYALWELPDSATDTLLTSCLGAGAWHVLDRRQVDERCFEPQAPAQTLQARFGDVAVIEAVEAPPLATAGEQVETRLLWHVLRAHPEPQQISIHVEDPDGSDGSTLRGNGTLPLYASTEWEVGERVLSRLWVSTDATAIPGPYRLSLGVGPAAVGRPMAAATWPGGTGDRAPFGQLSLQAAAPGRSAQAGLPSDMRALDGPTIAVGGLELIATRPTTGSVRPGQRLQVGLLWRAMRDGPVAAQCRLLLVREDGQVVQEAVAPLLRGRYAPSALRAGSLMRDEQSVVVAPWAHNEPLTLRLELLDSAGMVLAPEGGGTGTDIGSVRVEGRDRLFDPPDWLALDDFAIFGERIKLISQRVEPDRARPGSTVGVRLYWLGLREMQQGYKVFVHVLDPSGERVVAQQDAEPLGGMAPTSGWMPGELVEDVYAVAMPRDLPVGDYPIEIGLYEPLSGERLLLEDGQGRLILTTKLTITITTKLAESDTTKLAESFTRSSLPSR